MTKKEFFALCKKATNPRIDERRVDYMAALYINSDKPFKVDGIDDEVLTYRLYLSKAFFRYKNARNCYDETYAKYTRWLQEYREANP